MCYAGGDAQPFLDGNGNLGIDSSRALASGGPASWHDEIAWIAPAGTAPRRGPAALTGSSP